MLNVFVNVPCCHSRHVVATWPRLTAFYCFMLIVMIVQGAAVVSKWTMMPAAATTAASDGPFKGKVGETLQSTLRLDATSVACNCPAAVVAVRYACSHKSISLCVCVCMCVCVCVCVCAGMYVCTYVCVSLSLRV